MQVVGTACDGFDALGKIKRYTPDVVLLDIRMPNMNGVVATSHIKADYPNVKVLILTTFDDSDYILNALNNGACGYLLKDIGGEALIRSVKNAYEGDTILPAKVARRITDAAMHVAADRELKLMRAFTLSEREVEVALMMYEGFTNRQISSALSLSEGTTRNYVSSIYVKTGCENRSAAIDAIKEVLQ
jgi:DNA-binding NarL/FixJ family response regulator